MKQICALLLTTLLSLSNVWSGLVYEKHSYQKARDNAKQFKAVGQIRNTKKSATTYGTGSLVTIDGKAAILTAGHVIEGAKKLTFTLEINGKKATLALDTQNAHTYPLYTKFRDKMFDVAVIYLDAKQATFEGTKLTVPQLWDTPLSITPLRPLSLDYEDVDTRLISYAGYGTNGTFNKEGHVTYSEAYPRKIATQLQVTPKRNILYEHGCGYDEDINTTKEDVKKIAQKHFFWDREKKQNHPRTLAQTRLPLGAFSPGDSGAPLLYEGRVIGVVATAELPLIQLCAKDFYQFVPEDVRDTWIGWDNSFSQGSFAQGLIRSFAQFYHNIPEATVNLYQTAAAITPTVYQWMLTKAP